MAIPFDESDASSVPRVSSRTVAYVNMQETRNGWTALHFASANGHADTCQALLEYGADPTIESHDGKTAADLAEENGHHAVSEMISLRGYMM